MSLLQIFKKLYKELEKELKKKNQHKLKENENKVQEAVKTERHTLLST